MTVQIFQKQMESISLKSSPSTKRLYCETHGQRLSFKCECSHCESPFICSVGECLDGHFHLESDNKLVISKFDAKQYEGKMLQLESILKKQDFAGEAKKLKTFIDEMRNSMVAIYRDYKNLHSKKDQFDSCILNQPFSTATIDKVDSALELASHLKTSIDRLKEKIPGSHQGKRGLINGAGNGTGIEHRNRTGNENTSENPISLQNEGSQHLALSPILKIHEEENEEKKSTLTTSERLINQGEFLLNSQKKNILSLPNTSHFQKSNEQKGEIIELQNEEHQATNQQSTIPKARQSESSKLLNQQIYKKKVIGYEEPIELEKSSDSPLARFEDLFDPKATDKSQQKNGKINEGQKSGELNGSKNKFVSQSLTLLERDFTMKRQLTVFMEESLSANFSWDGVSEVYSSHDVPKSVERFHEMLQGRKNIFFLFIGEERILGSYYPSRYPRLTERIRYDKHSFLFISDENRKIVKYKAADEEFQLSVNEKLYICHGNTQSYADGIRTFQRNFETINYCLPSFSYNKTYDQTGTLVERKFSGIMKVEEFFIFQVLANV